MPQQDMPAGKYGLAVCQLSRSSGRFRAQILFPAIADSHEIQPLQGHEILRVEGEFAGGSDEEFRKFMRGLKEELRQACYMHDPVINPNELMAFALSDWT